MVIFIVDDSQITRDVIKQSLSLFGYTDITEAVNGKEALDKINNNVKKIDLYILDINMPEMDGLTLLSEIRKTDKITPVIILTTEADKEKMAKAKEKGANGWIIKPFNAEKLKDAVELLIKK